MNELPIIPLFDLTQPERDLSSSKLKSLYLTMRDGVRIAVDVWLPPHKEGDKLPTALRSTRYGRTHVGNPIADHLNSVAIGRWMDAEFALVLIDARGTGASFGTWPRPWDDDQRDDLVEILDWIIAQPWSDGTVGGFGTSYDGSTAHLLAATGHKAVGAVIPRFALLDSYHHIAMPGGVPLDWFLEVWNTGNWLLDGYPDRATIQLPLPVFANVRPVEGSQELREQAQREHSANWNLWETVKAGTSREHALGADGVNVEQGTALGRIEELRKARVPMWIWTSWFDGAYGAAAVAQLADPALDVRVTIGPWSHGAAMTPLGDPFFPDAPIEPDPHEQTAQMAAYLGFHADGSVKDPSPRRLRYYTLGHGFQEADDWPPKGSELSRWWLGEDSQLVSSAPGDGSEDYEVDFSATTGNSSTRWHTLYGGVPVIYPDRADADRKLLAWTSAELGKDTFLTGTPIVNLSVTSTRDDGAFFVYLEDASPDGVVTYVTEGQLRAIHRRLGEGPPPYETFGPWHTYSERDVQPLVPGERTELRFTMWPVSVLFKKGHRIRIALAGADSPLFRRIPAQGDVAIKVHRPGSFIELPFMK